MPGGFIFIAMAKSYSDKLKDPRWQKRRAEICQRDEWKCKLCGDNYETLHVHHKRYIKGNEPWEYEDDDLVTLCESCHGLVERGKKGIADYDINKAQSHCIINDDTAITIFRYEDRVPVIFTKRGTFVALSRNDAKRVFEILKNH